MGHEVFISYSSKDKSAANAVCAALEANGVRCWIAPRDIEPGRDWSEAIIDGIQAAKLMVLIFSQQSNESDQVKREVGCAMAAGLTVVPLRLEDVPMNKSLTYFLANTHWMDALTPPLEQYLREVTRMVRGLLEAGHKTLPIGPDYLPSPPASHRRRSRTPVFLVALLFAGVVGGWAFHNELPRHRATNAGPSGEEESIKPSSQNEVKNRIGMKFVRIDPGEFLMGSSESEKDRADNETRHKVRITRPFFLQITHVTRGQFAEFVNENAYRTDAEKLGEVNGASWAKPGFAQTDDHPVVEVSWNDAVAFCIWLTKKEGKRYRLPTEAEWEYACRAGEKSAYWWGDNPDEGQGRANVADRTYKEAFPTDPPFFNFNDGFTYTSPAGFFKTNPWGLHDMTGNASQWCSDYYGRYAEADAIDPTGPVQGDAKESRVLRGGAWFNGPMSCRAAYRMWRAPSHRSNTTGFRVCLDL